MLFYVLPFRLKGLEEGCATELKPLQRSPFSCSMNCLIFIIVNIAEGVQRLQVFQSSTPHLKRFKLKSFNSQL